jgi:Flp pilus assembly protein TadG
MSVFGSQAFQLSAVVAALLLSAPAQAQTRAQQIADEAAFAAAQVLSSGGQPADAAAAAEQSVAANSGIVARVSASSSDLSVTVNVSPESGKPGASSVARYLPPDQPANWAWASRQRFAVKSSPVMLGSSCIRDCEPNPLR